MPTMPSEKTSEVLRAQQALAGLATNGKTASTASTGKALSTGNPLQRHRLRDNEESRKSLPPSATTGKQQSISPGSHAEVRTGGQEGMVSSSPKGGEDHSYNNRVSHTHGNSNAAGLDRRRLPATGASNKSIRRPLSGDTGKPDRKTIADDRNGGGGRKSKNNNSTSGVRVAASGESATRVPWDLSHPKQFPDTRLDNGSFRGSRTPRDEGGAFYNDKDRREMAGLAAAHNANKSEPRPGPAAGTGSRRGTGGNRSSWGALPRDIPQRTAGRPTTAKIADDAFRNANRSRAGGEYDHGAEKNGPTGGGHSTGSSRSADHDPFAREQPGDRYYLPPPQRNLRQRKSQDDAGDTTNSGSTPRHHDQRRKDRQERSREVNEGERQHRTTRGSRASSSSVDRRRASFSSSDGLYGQRPDDHRSMLGASETSGLSKTPDWRYGWRGGPFSTNSPALSQEEESLPYYVDRKQVCIMPGGSSAMSKVCLYRDHNRSLVRFNLLQGDPSPTEGVLVVCLTIGRTSQDQPLNFEHMFGFDERRIVFCSRDSTPLTSKGYRQAWFVRRCQQQSLKPVLGVFATLRLSQSGPGAQEIHA